MDVARLRTLPNCLMCTLQPPSACLQPTPTLAVAAQPPAALAITAAADPPAAQPLTAFTSAPQVRSPALYMLIYTT